MAVNASRFKRLFPSFRNTDADDVESKLAFAKQRIAPSVWGDLEDQGVMYLTAHLLSIDPAGRNSRLKPENLAKTTYWFEYQRLMRTVTTGMRTAGTAPVTPTVT